MFPGFNFSLPPFPQISIPSPKIEIPKVNNPLEIAADSIFSNPTTNFSPGQTIYVRVVNQNTNSPTTHILNLHDSSYNILQTYNLQGDGNTFATNFQAPGLSGTYSLEAKLVVNSSSNNFVRTIQVGEGSAGNNVTINQVNNSNSTSSISFTTSTQSGTAEPPKPATQNPQVMGSSNRNIFVKMWLSIVKFWDNFWH